MEQIGEGGFATVYRAKESTTGKIVALKLLKDAYLKDNEVVERFRREVFAVASISSPYVVRMHDFGISGEEVFIAMEYVDGPTLREIVHERAWSPSDIHVVVGQIAQALAAAHRQNIIHRDLKPENVILVGDGGKSGPRTGQGARLWPRQARRARAQAGARAADARGCASERRSTCRPSRSRASRSTDRRTSTRSA